jgi:hypothetical protein
MTVCLKTSGRVAGMKQRIAKRGWHGLLIAMAASSLIGCGGGGGGGNSDPQVPSANTQSFSGTPPTVTFEVDKLEITAIEGTQGYSDGFLNLAFAATKPASFWLEEPKDYIVDGQLNADATSDNRFSFHFVLSSRLPPGVYDTEVTANACETDANYTNCLPGAPIGITKVPLHYVVKPNIHAQESVSLRRSGREPAPSQTIAVDIPKDAGVVTATLTTDRPDALQATLTNGQLTISTTQVRAGNYTGTVVLQGSTNPSYRRAVQVSYAVLPPPGGEHDLSVDKPTSSADLAQGQTTSVRIKVSRPTWTSVWNPPQLLNDNGLYSFRDLSNDEYELTVNASNAAQTSYRGALRFNVGTPVGNVDAQLYVNVFNAFGLSEGWQFSYDLTPASTEASLVRSSGVVTFDGVPAKWTAVSNVPWARLVNSSGTTGVDVLTVQIDKATAVAAPNGLGGTITLSIDRPGVPPIQRGVSVTNDLPRVARIVGGPLLGSAGRIYIDGYFPDFLTLVQDQVTVSGAQVTAVSTIHDSRMLYPTTLLVIDVTQATPGQPISIALTTPLLKTQVQQQVVAQEALPDGYVALPYGRYRPAQYSSGLRSLYVAGENQIFRWAHDSTAWTLTQASAPGLIDAAPTAEADWLYGLVDRYVVKFDPTTLQELARGQLNLYSQGSGWHAFDASAPSGMSAMSFAEDGRAFASLVARGDFLAGDRGVAAIRGERPAVLGQRSELTDKPGEDEPGNRLRPNPSAPTKGSGITRSASGRSVMALDPDGILWQYQVAQRQWVAYGQLPTGVNLVAVDDEASALVASDGTLRDNSASVKAHLANVLPQFYVPGGFGITRDGNVGLVYGYRIDTVNGQQRAKDAGIWVVDLRGTKGVVSGEAALPVLGRIALPDAVGCTTSLAQDESCVHQATITVSPGSQNAFVLGPRGLASVQIPPAMLSVGAAAALAQPASARVQAASIRVGGIASRVGTRLGGRTSGNVSAQTRLQK